MSNEIDPREQCPYCGHDPENTMVIEGKLRGEIDRLRARIGMLETIGDRLCRNTELVCDGEGHDYPTEVQAWRELHREE